ncbi:hypothetical protein BJV77DRAFT_1152848 [Russula vinacea]|nr:hypothetical protein BJV77DRAFT_1152848 [Russula vinacea]
MSARIMRVKKAFLVPSSWESNNECKGGCEAGLDDAKYLKRSTKRLPERANGINQASSTTSIRIPAVPMKQPTYFASLWLQHPTLWILAVPQLRRRPRMNCPGSSGQDNPRPLHLFRLPAVATKGYRLRRSTARCTTGLQHPHWSWISAKFSGRLLRHCDTSENHPLTIDFCDFCRDFFARTDSLKRHRGHPPAECLSVTSSKADEARRETQRIHDEFVARLQKFLSTGEEYVEAPFSQIIKEKYPESSKKHTFNGR